MVGDIAFAVAAPALEPRLDTGNNMVALGALAIGSMVAGGVLGGLTAHALAAQPRAAGPVTAVGLAPVYLFTIALTID